MGAAAFMRLGEHVMGRIRSIARPNM